MPQLSVLENILIPSLSKAEHSDATDRARELMRRVGLEQRQHHLPSQLSGGERGRVAVARSLLLKPDLLLADEPTGNLDQATADSITDLLLELQSEENTMLVAVTHSMELASRMKHTLRLDRGKLVEIT